MCFALRPEVAGDINESQCLDWTARPLRVDKLVYTFDFWLGDPVVEAIGIYLVTSDVADAMRREGFSGVTFEEVELGVTENFLARWSEDDLPDFEWIKIHGTPCRDDVGLLNLRMVVSKRMLGLLERYGLKHATISKLESLFGLSE